jgi:hypothetical protein
LAKVLLETRRQKARNNVTTDVPATRLAWMRKVYSGPKLFVLGIEAVVEFTNVLDKRQGGLKRNIAVSRPQLPPFSCIGTGRIHRFEKQLGPP